MAEQRNDNTRIIEGIMTTVSHDQADLPMRERVNIAPMGPIVTDAMDRFVLRPFNTSTTYRNLKATGQGVFHVTDDVLLLARAAIGRVDPGDDVPTQSAKHVNGLVLSGACRYYELRVVELDDRDERTTIVAETVARDTLRPFIGLNRAMHAVVEAAILATRLHLTGAEPVLAEFDRLDVLVAKTGSARERQAMTELRQHVERKQADGEWS